jgi:hypothetical protein
MAFDATKPAGTTKIRLSDEEIRANWAAIEDALARNHTFPGVLGSTAGEHSTFELRDQAADLTQEAGLIKIWNNAGALKFIVPGGSARHLDAVPTGTVMLFGQSSAPTGWTKKTDWTDNSMLVYTTGTPGAGGSASPTSFTPTASSESSHTHTGPSHYHTLSSHAHIAPSHTHSVSGNTGAAPTDSHGASGSGATESTVGHAHTVSITSGAGGYEWTSGPSADYTSYAGTGATGAGSSHTHTIAAVTPIYQQVIAATRV